MSTFMCRVGSTIDDSSVKFPAGWLEGWGVCCCILEIGYNPASGWKRFVWLNESKDAFYIPNPPFQYFHHQCSRTTSILSAGGNYQLNYEDDSHTEPFWLNQIRGVIRTARSLFFFLIEQPSQLKYIEWPSFQSTLKTATLTLVLVAFLIVALSSVDSALSYLLALLLRRKA
ncbi:hypothetical protein DH2020_025871 [Rehmannia glutinosa]|uniref:Uncharacterized protein n=1 Tax=Rehmannia glutinosa TaxID=99300 RepID=A0ABR0VYI5_REHGL